MPKRTVIHAAFRYTDTNGQRRRAFRGDVINVSRKDAERGDRAGAFGTAADLVAPGLDEGVVDLSAQLPTTTPVVPLVSNAALLEAALRERLGVEAGASQGDVLRALDTALVQAQAAPDPGTAPATAEQTAPGGSIPAPAPDAVPAALSAGGEIVVELPPGGELADEAPADDQAGQPGDGVDDEGLAEADDQVGGVPRPPLAAKVEKWRAYAVDQGMDEAEAAKASKADLIGTYGRGD